jgi:phosphoribosylformylglycinamidine cyclo-ligase
VSESRFTYRSAGVDRSAAEAVKRRLGELVDSTRTAGVRAAFGSFGGRFALEAGGELVASADGVGTKLRVAFMADRHDTVGEDLVNHCVNDILTEGAVPLFFLDYFACGRLDPDVAVAVVSGVARGCRANGSALLGGETAEMPDSYPDGEYDLAGFIVGRVAYPEVSRRELRAGDQLLGLASTGLHTNGYSLARAILFGELGLDVSDPWPGLGGTIGEVLLRVHRSYLEPLRGPCEAGRVRALAHITGGGIPGNLERILPPRLDAVVRTDSWQAPAEFRSLAKLGGIGSEEMFRTFNMGIGMIAAVGSDDAEEVLRAIEAAGCPACRCGQLEAGSGRVRLEATA